MTEHPVDIAAQEAVERPRRAGKPVSAGQKAEIAFTSFFFGAFVGVGLATILLRIA